MYKCKIICVSWIPTLAVFLTSICQLIPKDSGVSFNREVLEYLSPRSQQVWLAASIGASHKDRRKEKPHCRWGWVSSLCEFGHLLAEVSS